MEQNQRLENIETKLAYQEQANQTLSDVIFKQQKQIDQLELICQSLIQRVKDLSESEPIALEDNPPPHY